MAMHYRAFLSGAALMYFLDPRSGARRRAEAVSRGRHIGGGIRRAGAKGIYDLKNRAFGVISEARHLLQNEEVSDEVLHDRVRSALGRLTSHPGALSVAVRGGNLTLRGAILSDEAEGCLRALA